MLILKLLKDDPAGSVLLLLKALKIDYSKSTAMVNLYNSQLKKINKAMKSLHEDLQYEYEKDLDDIS
jgi:hypothetical protein